MLGEAPEQGAPNHEAQNIGKICGRVFTRRQGAR